MPRAASNTDFNIDVEGIGRFTFARRVVADSLRIRGRYNHLTEGFYDENGNMADLTALAFVSIQTLLVRAPDHFDIETLDPILDESYEAKILAVYMKLREKELSFRPKPAEDGKASGSSNVQGLPPVVSKNVQPGADGSALPGSN